MSLEETMADSVLKAIEKDQVGWVIKEFEGYVNLKPRDYLQYAEVSKEFGKYLEAKFSDK
jgi:hypothetical protein